MKPNRLSLEKSPYLLQHQTNPVDWFPWGEEALNRAKSQNKPILLSVGYSACHWCHVMAHECFENAAIAKLMNENFINIKVDREERPDLDQIYQHVAQAMTHGGGWPLTVFLTPDLKPFYGGTYFPPEDRYGRPGFPRVLEALAIAFKEDASSIQENAERLNHYIFSSENGGEPASKKEILDAPHSALTNTLALAHESLKYFDWENGGFKGAPKFPQVPHLKFLWRAGLASHSKELLDAVTRTLDKMACGGIHDQIGGGFHRYCVDEKWSVPHFEKMLYDNALLLALYSEVVVSGTTLLTPAQRPHYGAVVRDTVEFLSRDLLSPSGAFFCSLDADSNEGEGSYYVWDSQSLIEVLGVEDAKKAGEFFQVNDEGNFEESKTVLSKNLPQAPLSSDQANWIGGVLEKLLKARALRTPPQTDTKMLLSWNGLAISALAWAAQAARTLNDPVLALSARKTAERAFAACLASFSKARFLDDYAFMAHAALDLARFSLDPASCAHYLKHAEIWTREAEALFEDPEGAGFFLSKKDQDLIVRPRSFFDHAIPSGTSVLLQARTALNELFNGETPGASGLEHHFQALALQAQKSPTGCGEFWTAHLLWLMGPITISGGAASELCQHGHVFQKPNQAQTEGKMQICHKQVCEAPGLDLACIEAMIREKTKAQ